MPNSEQEMRQRAREILFAMGIQPKKFEAELAEHLTLARRETIEECCVAACHLCDPDHPAEYNRTWEPSTINKYGHWTHAVKGEPNNLWPCDASALRAKLTPAPEAEKGQR